MGIPEKALARGEQILEYIPQRSPIIMVDALYSVGEDDSVSGLTVTVQTMFCNGETLDECGVIEHIAQSAALRVGYICKTRGEKVPIGFIGSVEKLKMHSTPKIGDKLITTIKILQEIGSITLAAAETTGPDGLICECRMKIFLKTE